jgi:hypothetical protein
MKNANNFDDQQHPINLGLPITARVRELEGVNSHERLLLLLIASHRDEQTWVSSSTMARAMCTSRSTYYRTRASLLDKGLIEMFERDPKGDKPPLVQLCRALRSTETTPLRVVDTPVPGWDTPVPAPVPHGDTPVRETDTPVPHGDGGCVTHDPLRAKDKGPREEPTPGPTTGPVSVGSSAGVRDYEPTGDQARVVTVSDKIERHPSGEKPNRYPGPCLRCGERVEKAEGTFEKGGDGRYEPMHLDGTCPDPLAKWGQHQENTLHPAVDPMQREEFKGMTEHEVLTVMRERVRSRTATVVVTR